jgi:hypothetical protein
MERKKIIIMTGIILMTLLVSQFANAAIFGYTKEGYPACVSIADFEKVSLFFGQGDTAAVDKMINEGRCFLLKGGVEVYAWNPLYTLHPNWAKIRKRGETESIWTFWEAIEEKVEKEQKKVGNKEKIVLRSPTVDRSYIPIESFAGIKPGATTKKQVIQKYGKPFIQNWEEMRYETGAHPDFNQWDRVRFIFDKSGVLKEIRGERLKVEAQD